MSRYIAKRYTSASSRNTRRVLVRRSSPTSLPGTKRPTADAGTSHGFTTSGDAFILIDRFCRSFVVRASGTVIRCRLGAPMMVDLKEFGFGEMPERSRRERLHDAGGIACER